MAGPLTRASRVGAPGWRHRVPLVGAAVLTMIGALALYALHDQRAARDRARLMLEARAAVAAEYVARAFDTVDIMLQGQVTARRQDLTFTPRPRERIRESLRAMRGQLVHVREIALIGTDGLPEYSSFDEGSVTAPLTDRDYFAVHRDGDVGLFIGEPIQSRRDGRWFVSVSRRVADAAGRFAGIANASVEPASFRIIHPHDPAGRGSALALLSGGGRVIAFVPPDGEPPGDLNGDLTGRAADSVPLLAALDLGRAERGLLSRNGVLGMVRSVVGTPLSIVVALPEAEIARDWLKNFLPLGAASLLALAALFALSVVDARHAAARARVEAERDRFFDLSPDIACVTDMEYRFLRISPSAEAITGYSIEDLMETPILDLVHPDDREATRAATRRLRRGEPVAEFSNRHLRKDGGLVWLEWSAVPADGRIYAIARDVTQSKAAEERLDHLLAFQRAILDSASGAIMATDTAGVITLFNPAAETMTGWPAAEVVGRAATARFFPVVELEERARELTAELGRMVEPGFDALSARAAIEGGERREWSLLRRDGRAIPVILSWSPLRDPDGGLTGFLAIATDIASRRQTEAALRRNGAHLRAILDTVVDGIVTIDERGVITGFNPAAERIFGYAAAEVVGGEATMLMTAPHRSRHAAFLERYLTTGEKRFIGHAREEQARRKDGTVFPIEIAVGEVQTSEGRVFTGLVRDITERKRVERMKNEFIATVSHELRTPLTSIRGSLGLVAGGAAGTLPDKARGLVDIAHKNTERLIALVNDILDIQKIESGRIDIRPRVFPVARLVARAVETDRAFAERAGVALRVAEVADAELEADFDRLLQVMGNLLSNAVKFSPRGGAVTITARREGRWIRIAVADQGPGVPPEFRPRLFERFAQADSTDSRRKAGTGLGLSIVKALVERMGGAVGFESKAGRGATFHFALPEHRAAPDEGPDRRVLVVEDDAGVAEILRVLLTEDGFLPDVAHNARRARELLARHGYVAMTLDARLSATDGFAFLRASARFPGLRIPPAVMLSAEPPGDRPPWGDEGPRLLDWIEKPIDRDRLRAALRDLPPA